MRTGADAPAARRASIAALNLALLLIVSRLSPVIFYFEIKVSEVGQQTENDTGKNADRRPLAGADFIEKLEQPVTTAANRCDVGSSRRYV